MVSMLATDQGLSPDTRLSTDPCRVQALYEAYRDVSIPYDTAGLLTFLAACFFAKRLRSCNVNIADWSPAATQRRVTAVACNDAHIIALSLAVMGHVRSPRKSSSCGGTSKSWPYRISCEHVRSWVVQGTGGNMYCRFRSDYLG